MSICKRREPPKDWVKSLVNNEKDKPEQSYYLESTGGYDDLRPLKFPNLIFSLTRFGHVLEEYI